MHRVLLVLCLFVVSGLVPARAEAVLKIINFTADWCPNCQVLNPRMDEAIGTFEAGLIERVDLDMTLARRGSDQMQVINTLRITKVISLSASLR